MSARLEVWDLELRYGPHRALRGVDLTAAEGELTVLLGPSGCGKTSLLRAVAGFEVPEAGSIEVGGEPVVGPGLWVPPEKRRIGMVFQQGALFPHLDVMANVRYGLRGRPGADALARGALERVGMAAKAGRFPDQLSGGEQQRVALARALAPSPRLILLDEPFASLDAGLRQRLREEVRSVLRAAETTAVLVTHDQEEALSLGDTVVVMSAGRILQAGAPEEVYRQPASLEVARFVGEGQLLACRVRTGRAETRLGTVPCEGAEGPGWLWVRPEDLELLGPAAAAGLPGTVRRRTFYGHDLVDEVELAPAEGERPEVMAVRSLAGRGFAPGEPVRLALRERRFQVFPDPE